MIFVNDYRCKVFLSEEEKLMEEEVTSGKILSPQSCFQKILVKLREKKLFFFPQSSKFMLAPDSASHIRIIETTLS